jgi:hypothetical protein
MFSAEADGEYITHGQEAGTHGYINNDPKMQAIFMASGACIKKGASPGAISNLDVAPTIAWLLGLEMNGVQGHVLQSILDSRCGR